MDVLHPADAFSLLTQGKPLRPPERAEAEALAEELGFHPLACDVAGLQGRKHQLRRLPAAARRNVGRFDELAAHLADQLPGGHARQITATLATSMQQLGAEAWQLLRVAGVLAQAPIPRALLVAAFAQLASGGEEAAELALNQALQDPHCDGLFAYDLASEAITVHVLVSAAATVTRPGRREKGKKSTKL